MVKKILIVVFILVIFIVNVSATVPNPTENENYTAPSGSYSLIDEYGDKLFFGEILTSSNMSESYNAEVSNSDGTVILTVDQDVGNNATTTYYSFYSSDFGTVGGTLQFNLGVYAPIQTRRPYIMIRNDIIGTATVHSYYFDANAQKQEYTETIVLDGQSGVKEITFTSLDAVVTIDATITIDVTSQTDFFDGEILFGTDFLNDSQEFTDSVFIELVNSARSRGWQDGYQYGLADGSDGNLNLFGWLAEAINGVTQIELFGPGFSIGDIFLLIFAVVVIRAILVFFAGG